MKKYFLISLLISIAIYRYSLAQDKNNYLSGSFGGSDFHILDKHASPLIFSSIGIAPSLQYMYKGESSRHYAEASYYYDYLGTTAGNFKTSNYRGRIRYVYLHSITNFEFLNNALKLFLGGSVGTYLCHSDYYYAIKLQNSQGNESWYWSNSLDIFAQLEYPAGQAGNPALRESFSLQISLPVISSVTRPKYSRSGDFNYEDSDRKFTPPWPWKNGETKFLTENFSVNVILAYQRPLFWNFDMRLTYEFYYSSYAIPRDVNMYMNNLRAGLTFCF